MRQKVFSKFLSLFPSLRVEITATNVSTNNQKRNDGGKRTKGAIKYTITKESKKERLRVVDGDRRRHECEKKGKGCTRGANVPPHVHATLVVERVYLAAHKP